MRLLHVAPFFEPDWARGGMARASAGLARALAARGHQVTVVTTRPLGAPAEETRDGVLVIRWKVPAFLERRLFPWVPGMASRLAGLAREADIGHVHGHRSGLALAASKAFAVAGVPFVLQPHGTFGIHGQRAVAKRIYDRLAGRRVLERCAALVAVSDAEARGLPRSAAVVPNGVAIPPGRGPQAEPGQRLLFVGNDRPQKRGLRLRGLLAVLPEARLEVVGVVGRAFRAAFAPMADRVTWRGALPPEELARAYGRADLVVHPAVGEAFGLVPFEAALCGTASVAAGDHGCGEWLRRAGGCTVPADDAGALLEALRERLADPGRRRAEAQAVARYAARELTWESAARRVEVVYERLRAARPRSVA